MTNQSNILRIIVLIFLFMVINISVFGQIELSPLTKFDTWNVAVIGVQTDDYEGLEDDQKLVSVTLRPILTAVIKEVNFHTMTTEEKKTAQILQKEDALSILSKKMEELQAGVATENLNEEKGEQWKKNLEKAKEIRQLNRRIRKLKKIDPHSIDIKNQLPIVYKEQSDYLNISNVTDYRSIAVELGVHSLLYYHLFQLEDHVVVEMYEYNVLTQFSRKVLQTIISPQNVAEITNSLKLSLRSVLLGGPSTSLNITVVTTNDAVLYDAKILLDGELVGFGYIELPVLLAGTHTIHVVYNSKEKGEVVVLKENDSMEKSYFYDMTPRDVILIESVPAGAKVYRNAQWVGNTPVVIERPVFIEQLEIVKPGYVVHRESVSVTSAQKIQADLQLINPIPLQERLAIDRKKFYNAFSMFALSLAAPIVFNGFFINESNALSIGEEQLSAAGRAESLQRKDAYFYTFIGTSLVSTGFAIFAYIRLQKYLKTASEYQER